MVAICKGSSVTTLQVNTTNGGLFRLNAGLYDHARTARLILDVPKTTCVVPIAGHSLPMRISAGVVLTVPRVQEEILDGSQGNTTIRAVLPEFVISHTITRGSQTTSEFPLVIDCCSYQFSLVLAPRTAQISLTWSWATYCKAYAESKESQEAGGRREFNNFNFIQFNVELCWTPPVTTITWPRRYESRALMTRRFEGEVGTHLRLSLLACHLGYLWHESPLELWASQDLLQLTARKWRPNSGSVLIWPFSLSETCFQCQHPISRLRRHLVTLDPLQMETLGLNVAMLSTSRRASLPWRLLYKQVLGGKSPCSRVPVPTWDERYYHLSPGTTGRRVAFQEMRHAFTFRITWVSLRVPLRWVISQKH